MHRNLPLCHLTKFGWKIFLFVQIRSTYLYEQNYTARQPWAKTSTIFAIPPCVARNRATRHLDSKLGWQLVRGELLPGGPYNLARNT